MFGEELVTRTKFILPRPKRTFWGRERLYHLLDEVRDFPLAVLTAGTGYGKSSLLADYLENRKTPGFWYALSERDADPQVFALHLAHLAHRHHPGSADRSLDLLAMPGGAFKHGLSAMEALADGLLDRLEVDTWCVLDDFHLLEGSPEAIALVNHLIQHRPPRLHFVLASRRRPELPDLARWRLQGDVLFLDQATLAFEPHEIEALFRDRFDVALDPDAVERLMTETEGWAMALQLVAQQMASAPSAVQPLPGKSAGTQRDLFDYLAREVLDKLSEQERAFLLRTSVLQRLEVPVCDRLLESRDASQLLKDLADRGLFLTPLGGQSYRQHHLFREFLNAQLAECNELQERHRAAARAYLALGEAEDAIEHLLEAQDLDEAVEQMVAMAPTLVAQGRFARLDQWMTRLPATLLDRHPDLYLCQGDACRLTSRFDQALVWYDRAGQAYGQTTEGRSRALTAKALVYLDTLQPALAELLLEEALTCDLEGRRAAELKIMLAENKLNQGNPRAAEALLREARSEIPEAVEHEGRLFLRTGRLAEGRALLLSWSDPAGTSTRSHRDASLVLSLFEAFLGEPEAALQHATEGLERGRTHGAAWAEATGCIRQGHAFLLLGRSTEAEGAYRQALALAGSVGVPRLRAEPLMGLVLVCGRSRDLSMAETFAKEGLELAQTSGDPWLSALLSLALGAVFAQAGDPKAERWLMQAQTTFDLCHDTYGQALAALWFVRLAMTLGENKAAQNRTRTLLSLVKRHDYGFLITRPTLLGFADEQEVHAFTQGLLGRGIPRASLSAWLPEADPSAPAAPERQAALRVRMLGSFRVWRGAEELGDRAWGREKARQLFHLFVTFRGELLPKARIMDLLWPDLDARSADQTFRVALNALNKALDPDRPSGQSSRFIQRQSLSYGLQLSPDVWIDVVEFERLLDAAQAEEEEGEDATELYRSAVELSEGDYLKDFPQYEAWCEQERERLADRYTEGALKLARLFAKRGDDASCIHWAQRLIERNRSAEEAYRLLMIAYYRQGDRPMALRTYDRCVASLAEELDVDPMPETEEVFERITNLQPITF